MNYGDKPSEAAFEECGETALDQWIESGTLEPADLTFALEIAAARGTPRSEYLCRQFAQHESALVREGAIAGLACCVDRAKAVIDLLAENDPSPGVRETARDALESVQ